VTHPGDEKSKVNNFQANRPPRLASLSQPNISASNRMRSVSAAVSPRDKKVGGTTSAPRMPLMPLSMQPKRGQNSNTIEHVPPNGVPSPSARMPSSGQDALQHAHSNASSLVNANSVSGNTTMNSFLFGEDSSEEGDVNNTRRSSSQLVNNMNSCSDSNNSNSDSNAGNNNSNNNDSPHGPDEETATVEEKKSIVSIQISSNNTSANNSAANASEDCVEVGKQHLRDSEKRKKDKKTIANEKKGFTDKVRSSAEKKEKPRRSSMASVNVAKNLSASEKDGTGESEKCPQAAYLEKRRDRKQSTAADLVIRKMTFEEKDTDGSDKKAS
jgi:hypothetical protein